MTEPKPAFIVRGGGTPVDVSDVADSADVLRELLILCRATTGGNFTLTYWEDSSFCCAVGSLGDKEGYGESRTLACAIDCAIDSYCDNNRFERSYVCNPLPTKP
jgi:hypothetical protein